MSALPPHPLLGFSFPPPTRVSSPPLFPCPLLLLSYLRMSWSPSPPLPPFSLLLLLLLLSFLRSLLHTMSKVIFNEGVAGGRISMNEFVALTSTNAASPPCHAPCIVFPLWRIGCVHVHVDVLPRDDVFCTSGQVVRPAPPQRQVYIVVWHSMVWLCAAMILCACHIVHADCGFLATPKGTIAPGADADVVIWDADAETIITQDALHHHADYTPFEGMAVRGRADTVLSRGMYCTAGHQMLPLFSTSRFPSFINHCVLGGIACVAAGDVIIADGKPTAAATLGRGEFLPRAPYDLIRPSNRFVTPANPYTGQVTGRMQ